MSMAAEWCAIQRDAARTMSAKVENHVTDIATRITATATVQVGDISRRINCAKTAPKNLHLVGYGNWNGEGSATLMRVGSFVKHTDQVVAGCVDETRQHSEWMSAVSRPLNYSNCGTKRVSQ